MALIFAVAGALLIAAGAGMVAVPLGLAVGGAELIAAAYVTQYLRSAVEDPRRPRP